MTGFTPANFSTSDEETGCSGAGRGFERLLVAAGGGDLEGVEDVAEQAVVANQNGQLEQTLSAEGGFDLGVHGVRQGVVREQGTHGVDDERFLGIQAGCRALLTDRFDGLDARAFLERERRVRDPLDGRAKLASGGHDGQLSDRARQDAVEAE